MVQAAAVNVAPDGGVIVEKLDGHPMHAPPSSATFDEKKESPSATEEEHADYGMQYAQQIQHVQQHLHQQQQHQQHYHNPYAQHQYAPHVIGGMIPPQQVYIQQQQQHQHHQHHMPLESQFHNMGLGETNGAGGGAQDANKEGDESGNSDENNGDANNESQNNNDGADGSNNAGGERQIAGEEGDGNGSDEEPIKLFVGQVREQKERYDQQRRNGCSVDTTFCALVECYE